MRAKSFFLIILSFFITITLIWRILFFYDGAVSTLDWNISPHTIHVIREFKNSLFMWFYSPFLYGFGRDQGQLFQLNWYGFLSFLGLIFKNKALSKAFLSLVIFLNVYFFALFFELFSIPCIVYMIGIVWGLLTPFYVDLLTLGAGSHLINFSFFVLDFYLMERYFSTLKFRWLLLLIFSWLIVPIFISVVILLIIIIRIMWEKVVKNNSFVNSFFQIFFTSIIILMLFFALQLYWILPLFLKFFSTNKFSELTIHIESIPNILNLFSLSGFWNPIYENFLKTLPTTVKFFFLLNYTIPGISIVGLLYYNNLKINNLLFFYLLLFILFLGFPIISEIIITFPLVNTILCYFLRDLTSIYTVLTIIETFFFVFFLRELYRRKFLFFLLISFFVLPKLGYFVYNGRFLVLKTVSGVKSYIIADKWVRTQHQTNFKVLWLPTGSPYIESGLKDGTWCSDFWALFSSVPGGITDINYRNTFIYKFGYQLLKKLYTNDSEGLVNLLKLSNIRYLIVRLDRENNQWAAPSYAPEWNWKVKNAYSTLKLLNFLVLKNFGYTKIFYNQNFLPHSYISSLSNSFPFLTFRRINPTKYEIKVENASTPFFLIFSESYHPKWKAYIEINNERNKEKWQIIAEYPKLHVKEAKHDWYKFTPQDIKYLFKKSLPEKYHFLVNGYANAWYINPKEIGSSNFIITLYFWPQSLFYVGLFISSFTFLACLGYLTYDWGKRKLNV